MELYFTSEYSTVISSMNQNASVDNVYMNYNNSDLWKYYLADGRKAGTYKADGTLSESYGPAHSVNDTAKGQWVYLEFARTRTTNLNAGWSHISMYFNQYCPCVVYFGDVTISNRSLASLETGRLPEMKLEPYTLNQLELINDETPFGWYLSNYNYNNAVTNTLTKTTEDIDGVGLAGTAYEWNVTKKYSVTQPALLQFTAPIRTNFSGYNYLYFDVYLTEAGEQMYMINGSATWRASADKPYAGQSTILCNANGQKGDTLNDYKFFNPETGEQITEGNLSTLNGQWVRVRLRTSINHAYHGWVIENIPTGRIFMRNIWVSKTADLYTKADGATKY